MYRHAGTALFWTAGTIVCFEGLKDVYLLPHTFTLTRTHTCLRTHPQIHTHAYARPSPFTHLHVLERKGTVLTTLTTQMHLLEATTSGHRQNQTAATGVFKGQWLTFESLLIKGRRGRKSASTQRQDPITSLARLQVRGDRVVKQHSRPV